MLTGRQRPLTEVALSSVELATESGYEGLGFGYSKRAGGPGPRSNDYHDYHGYEATNMTVGAGMVVSAPSISRVSTTMGAPW